MQPFNVTSHDDNSLVLYVPRFRTLPGSTWLSVEVSDSMHQQKCDLESSAWDWTSKVTPTLSKIKSVIRKVDYDHLVATKYLPVSCNFSILVLKRWEHPAEDGWHNDKDLIKPRGDYKEVLF